MAAQRHSRPALIGTFCVLIALLGVRAVAADPGPVLGFNPELQPIGPQLLAPMHMNEAPLIRLGFEPTPPESRVPLFEYCPLVEVMQASMPMPVMPMQAVPCGDVIQADYQVAPRSETPLFEYRPYIEAVQPIAYTQPPPQNLPLEIVPQIETPVPTLPAPSPSQAPIARSLGCCPFMPDICHEGCWDPCIATCKRFCSAVGECLCHADPCYVPCWQPIADTAFDVAAVRPRTQQRLRWDAGFNLVLPDRSEFFWARADGNGRGPAPAPGRFLASNRIRHDDVSYYFEAAIDRFALIVSVPYRSVSPADYPHSAGFGDIRFGAKSLIFDCELLQIGTQLLAYAPTGNASKGLGVGHYSIEPSLLLGLRVGPATHLQAQVSEWIPLRGDLAYAGAVLHTHVALNHTLCHVGPHCPLIGTFGVNTWSFQDGAYTDPVFGPNQRSSGTTYCSMGPGLRLFICDCIDLGVGMQFSVTNPHFADQLYTTEFRWRF